MTALLVLLTILAVYRVTRLLTEDKIPIVAQPRDFLVNWLDPLPSDIAAGRRQPTSTSARAVAYLLTCPWCMSVWVGAALLPVVHTWVAPLPYPWLLWPAASAVTGLIAAGEGLADRWYELAEARTKLATAEYDLVRAQTAQARLTLPETMRG